MSMRNKSKEINENPWQKEAAPFFDQCPKFSTMHQPKNDLDRIVAYMYLKQHKYDAKKFSQKRVCRLDATQEFDGPGARRILKIRKNNFDTINGWQNVGGDLQYDYPNGWKSHIQEICVEDQTDSQMQKHFDEKEAKMKHGYKARIEYMQNYFKEIEDMYHIDDLKDSIKNFREIYRKTREEPKAYMKHKGIRFYEILPWMKQNDGSTLVDSLEAFRPISQIKLKEKSKPIDILFKHLNPKADQKPIEVQPEELVESQKVLRTMSQIWASTQQDKEQMAQEFNQQEYLFEVKDVNSFGQQLRQNKLKQIMDEMFSAKQSFQNGLHKFVDDHIRPPQEPLNISQANLMQIQKDRQNVQTKEMKRMSRSSMYIPRRISLFHSSGVASTCASQHNLKKYNI